MTGRAVSTVRFVAVIAGIMLMRDAGAAAGAAAMAADTGAATPPAAVRVIIGPTPILQGNATAAGDITVVNGRLAFALAVDSAVPYGVPRGAIVDVAPVEGGVIGRDRVVFADFIPNNWSAWPNSYQHVTITEQSPERVVIRAVRDWGKVVIATLYTLDADADHVEIRTTMTNGGTTALPGLLSGLTLWPNSGFLFAVPGALEDTVGGPGGASAAGALADRVVAYDERWAVSLHAAGFDHVGDGSMDLYRLHTLAPGASESFEGWLQVGASGDLAPVVRAEIERRGLAFGVVRGTVLGADRRRIDQPVIVVECHGKPYAWTVGREGAYEMALPVGDYLVYASAKNYSQSRRLALKVTSGATQTRDFRNLDLPGSLQFTITNSVTGEPLDARIAIEEGQQPVAQFLGRKTFFTELATKGAVSFAIAPGDYAFKVTAGGGFSSESRIVKLRVQAGAARAVGVALTPLFEPSARGWFGADLHHHADQAEAVTPPEDLARAQLAAGLDLLFVSDHDSTVNHRPLQAIADRRGVPLIPAMELSASWGHFNAYPLRPGLSLAIDTTVATIDEIFAEARRQGASVVQVNHPFIPYGYFSSVEAGVAPGGFDPAFELIEINAAVPGDDVKVMHALWAFWNAGHHYYLSAGTDTHDVWSSESGSIRVFAHLEGRPSAAAFADALKTGHAYVSSGPLIFPETLFGDERKVRPGEPFRLGFDFKSVAGLKKAELIGGGAVLRTEDYPRDTRQTHIEYSLQASRSTWYSLIVEDVAGHRAYTDPIWIDTVAYSGAPP